MVDAGLDLLRLWSAPDHVRSSQNQSSSNHYLLLRPVLALAYTRNDKQRVMDSTYIKSNYTATETTHMGH